MIRNDYDYLLKFILIGDSSKFIDNKYRCGKIMCIDAFIIRSI